MRWKGRRESENVEDRRGRSGGFGFPFPRRGGGRFPFPSGGRMPIPGGKGGGGLIGVLVIVGLMLLFGVDPRVLIDGMQEPGSGPESTRQFPFPGQTSPEGGTASSTRDDDLKKFVSVVLADTEDVWSKLLAAQSRRYAEPTLVLFRRATQSGCGTGIAQMGPFYCPLDRKVYIDLSFYEELKNRFRAPGDFAQAYVIAHEVGHHVQTLLGITQRVQQARAASSEREGNAIQVRMELQADCFAGLWAHHTNKTNQSLEPGDVDEALRAASAIGDDTIQRRTQGQAVPDSFTHGSSEQRVRWFRRGFENGTISACDTFSATTL